MTQEQKDEITKISKEFADGLGIPINGSGWLVSDPLSGLLNVMGHENKLHQLPASDKYPQIMVLTFADGSQLIPAGGDLKLISPLAENWMWL